MSDDWGSAPGVPEDRPELSVSAAFWLTMFFVVLNLLAALTSGAVAASVLNGVDPALLLFGLLMVAYAITLLVVWRTITARGRDFAETVGLRRVGIEAVAAGAGVAVALRFAAGLWAWFVQLVGLELQGADIDPTDLLPAGPVGGVLTALLIVVAAPVVEEIVFRGVLQTALARRHSVAYAVSLSALLFTIVHLNAFASVPILFAGAAFGLMAVRWGSLWPAIVAHAVFNGMGLGFLYLARFLGVST